MEFRRLKFNVLHLAAVMLTMPFTFCALSKEVNAYQKPKTQKRQKSTSNDDSSISPSFNFRSSVISDLPLMFDEPATELKSFSDKDKADKTETHLDLRRSVMTDIPLLSYRDLCFSAPVEEGKESTAKELIHTFVATAYCIKNVTACGLMVRTGVIAADPSILPLGSIVRIDAGKYSGTYRVLDTGPGVRGKRLDIYMPCRKEAITFGRRKVQIEIVRYGWGEKETVKDLQTAPVGQ